MAQHKGQGGGGTDEQVVPVAESAIVAYHAAGLGYAGPQPVQPGSVFGSGRSEHLQPDHRVPVMWRSREGGLLQADNDKNDGVELLWALKDHVRTKAKTIMFNANVVLDAASQHSQLIDVLKALQVYSRPADVPNCRNRGSAGCSSTVVEVPKVSPAHDSSKGDVGEGSNAAAFAPEGHLTHQLEAFAILAASRPGDYLQSRFQQNWQSVYSHRSDFWRLFSSARPFTAAMTTRSFQCLLCVLGCIMLVLPNANETFRPHETITKLHVYEFSSLRFTATRLRNGASKPDITSSGISAFGLLKSNCTVSHASERVLSSGASEYLHFSETVSFDGWYVTTGNGPAERDPVQFILEGSSDSKTWHPVAMSSKCGW
jgi:hypothetical protein